MLVTGKEGQFYNKKYVTTGPDTPMRHVNNSVIRQSQLRAPLSFNNTVISCKDNGRPGVLELYTHSTVRIFTDTVAQSGAINSTAAGSFIMTGQWDCFMSGLILSSLQFGDGYLLHLVWSN